MTQRLREFIPGPGNTGDLRQAFGSFGTGVTVVTTMRSDGPLGMTANSFSSVSLDPPLVLWAPAVSSMRHDAFTVAQDFCIHVLSAGQLKIARHFASNGHGFSTFDWAVGPDGAPALKGCLAEFHCTRHAVHTAGDHSLVIGKVRHVRQSPDTGPGLLFERGQFGAFTPRSGQ